MVEVLILVSILALEISFAVKACLMMILLLLKSHQSLVKRLFIMGVVCVFWLINISAQERGLGESLNREPLAPVLEGYCYNVQKNSCDIYLFRNRQWDKLKVSVFEMPKVWEGKPVTIGKWKPFAFDTANLDGFDQEAFLVAKGYRGVVKAKHQDFSNSALGPDPKLVRRLAYFLKSQLILRGQDLTPEAAMLYNALLLGVLPDDDEFKLTLQTLGLLHLFVVSGFHFSVVMAVVSLLSGPLSKKRYLWRQGILLVASTAYYLATWGGFGSWRALIFIVLGIFAFHVKRPVKGHIGISLIMLCAIFVRPAVLSQFGFIVTFLASAIVIVTGQKLATINIKGEPLPQMIILFSQSLIVYIAVLPFVLDAYGSSNLLQIALTVLATPLVVAFVWISAMWVVIWPVPIISPYIAHLVAIFSAFIMDMLGILKGFGMVSVMVSHRWVLVAQIAVWVICALWAVPRIRKVMNTRHLIASCLMLVMLVSGVILICRVDWGLSIRTFALRDGDAFLIRGPGLVALYDVGNDPQLLQLLDKAGVDALDYVIISHPHQDHMGLLTQITDRYQIGQVITTCESETVLTKGAFQLRLSRLLNTDDLNEGSIVLDGYYSGIGSSFSSIYHHSADPVRFMLTGDIEEKGVAWLLERYSGHVDLFKAPHHGSYVKSYPQLLASFTPDVVWITGGRSKRVNKLRAKADLSDAKMTFYDTMEHGELYYGSYLFGNAEK